MIFKAFLRAYEAIKKLMEIKFWRKGWDSNPRMGATHR